MNGPLNAIDSVKQWNNRAIVENRDPYSFIALDLGVRYTAYKINLVVVALRIECCRNRFHDIQVSIGNVLPVNPLGK